MNTYYRLSRYIMERRGMSILCGCQRTATTPTS